MNAEILTIGDELCRGEIVDTNSSWLAAQLWDLGVTVTWMTSCRDDAADMRAGIERATSRADVVLISGGLGPTEDDLTVDVIADVAGVGITRDEPSMQRMKERFEKARFALTPNNLRQVRVPEGARVHTNPAGIAPGFEMTLGRATVFVFPGVPREMQSIFSQSVAERVVALAASGERIAKRIYRVFGKGESHLDHALTGLGDAAGGVSMHYQVSFPETLVKVVVRHADAASADRRLAQLDVEVRQRIGDLIYGEGADSLASVLGKALTERGASLAVAESCTGGMLGALVTEVSGSSAYFAGGWIVYANEMKQQELGVSAETLATHGAVSQACVEELASAARTKAGATYGAAISGIAGPGGGTPEKPVGTVHIAVATPTGTRHKLLMYPGARDQIRRLACYWAMSMILRDLRRPASD